MARTFTKKDQEMKRTVVDNNSCKVLVDDPQVFKAALLDIRGSDAGIQYLVKWKGYSGKYNEWVDQENVSSDLVRKFSRDKKKKEIKLLKAEQAVRLKEEDDLKKKQAIQMMEMSEAKTIRNDVREEHDDHKLDTAKDESANEGESSAFLLVTSTSDMIPSTRSRAMSEVDSSVDFSLRAESESYDSSVKSCKSQLQ